jgi:hypothetical protein
MSEEQSDNNFQRKLSRRDFLRLAGAGAVTVAAAVTGDPKLVETISQFAESQRFPDEEIPHFEDIVDLEPLPFIEGWDAERVQNLIQEAVQESLISGQKVEVELPPGNILVDKKIHIEVPSGAEIILKGNTNSRLTLSQELSNILKTADNNDHNLLEFDNVAGAVHIERIDFDGGSTRAGHGDYEAPDGPWDAVVLINGAGEGSGRVPAEDMFIGDRQGEVTISHCRVFNSESAGFFTKNLKKVEVIDSEGRRLDSVVCGAWCDEIATTNVKAQDIMSDGLAFWVCDNGTVNNCAIKTSRQGILMNGSHNFDLKDCYAEDCGFGYMMYNAENNRYNDENIQLKRCHSRGGALAFAVDYGHNIRMADSYHTDLGAWKNKVDFLHTGIVDPTQIRNIGVPVWIGPHTSPEFKNVKLQKLNSPSTHYLNFNSIPMGIKTYGF